jgi:hypothetical protein
MTRRSLAVVVVVAAVCGASASCGLTGGARPPADPAAAARWWADRVDDTPPDFLAVYVEAAEVHRRRGTAATYVELVGGHNMLGRVGEEIRLPCPPPADVLARMREKVTGAGPSNRLLTVEACRGCTPEEAERIWREAAERVRERQTGSALNRDSRVK